MDFRHLDAVTEKGRYPVPIIDEFLDEWVRQDGFQVLTSVLGFRHILVIMSLKSWLLV